MQSLTNPYYHDNQPTAYHQQVQQLSPHEHLRQMQMQHTPPLASQQLQQQPEQIQQMQQAPSLHHQNHLHYQQQQQPAQHLHQQANHVQHQQQPPPPPLHQHHHQQHHQQQQLHHHQQQQQHQNQLVQAEPAAAAGQQAPATGQTGNQPAGTGGGRVKAEPKSVRSASSTSSATPPQTIYPWMKKAHVGQNGVNSMGETKRQRTSYTRFQTLELEKEFHFNRRMKFKKEHKNFTGGMPPQLMNVQAHHHHHHQQHHPHHLQQQQQQQQPPPQPHHHHQQVIHHHQQQQHQVAGSQQHHMGLVANGSALEQAGQQVQHHLQAAVAAAVHLHPVHADADG